MADSMVVNVDPPPEFDFNGLSIPPFDPDYLSEHRVEDDQNNVLSLDDYDIDFVGNDVSLDDFDFDLDNICLPSSDELDFGQVHQFDPQFVFGPSDPQFDPISDQFSNHGVSKSISSEQCRFSGEGDLSGPVNALSPESNGSNHGSSEQWSGDAKGMNWPSPVSQGSGNCRSDVSDDPNVCANRVVSDSPNLSKCSIKVGDIEQNIKLGDSAKKSNGNSSVLKRKKGAEDLVMNNNVGSRSNKHVKSDITTENTDEVGMSEEEKRKARLIRNRESAQLSRQRKKQYVEVLEDKVKAMDSMIQDLNCKISYFMAENATLRQQMCGGGVTAPVPMATPPPGMYPHPAMMYPWMPYMVKPQGSQVPLVPIPRLKRQQPAQAPKVSKKVESKKNEGRKTKKVAGVSFLGLLFFIMLFGGLVPMVNVRYGGVREAFSGYVGRGFNEKHHGRVLMVNGTNCGEKYSDLREFSGINNEHCGQSIRGPRGEPSVDEVVRLGNGREPLAASLYVPKNNKLVKIDGNLVIHSVLASEKAMTAHCNEGGETGLAVPGDLSPAIRVAGMGRNVARHLPLRALPSGSADEEGLKSMETDGTVHQWFREGLTGPLLTSGMCTKVFEFDVSSAIVPVPTSRNMSEDRSQNSTHVGELRNRRILRGLPIPLSEASHNISAENAERNSRKENFNGINNSSSMVVSVLVDPKEAGGADIDGVTGTKSISRIFVVVLIDSVKYVTYSCRLPFMGSVASHL